MIQIYCGEGKGKTSAAVGAAVRFSARGRVLFVQMMKSGESGEVAVLSKFENISVFQGFRCKKFVKRMSEREKEKLKAVWAEDMSSLEKEVRKDYGMVVLDEVCSAVRQGMIAEEKIESILEEHSEKELVLTGRSPLDFMLERADYISEIKKIRHPFDKGVRARKGVEY
jgi:cob(I)alamin adenosyltransferase